MKLLLFLLINLLGSLAASAHGISEADQGKILAGGPLEYLKQGASHMLTGYDHLLFLLGVVFLLTKFTDIFKLVTAFTVGHCITLMSATLLCIHANYTAAHQDLWK
jgi:HupE / UreJ protein